MRRAIAARWGPVGIFDLGIVATWPTMAFVTGSRIVRPAPISETVATCVASHGGRNSRVDGSRASIAGSKPVEGALISRSRAIFRRPHHPVAPRRRPAALAPIGAGLGEPE